MEINCEKNIGTLPFPSISNNTVHHIAELGGPITFNWSKMEPNREYFIHIEEILKIGFYLKIEEDYIIWVARDKNCELIIQSTRNPMGRIYFLKPLNR